MLDRFQRKNAAKRILNQEAGYQQPNYTLTNYYGALTKAWIVTVPAP